MNKAELSAAVAEKIGASKKVSEQAVNAVFETITEALAKGEKVQLASSSASAPSRSRSAPPASAATPEPRKRSPSPLPVSPLSKSARRSRMTLRSKE